MATIRQLDNGRYQANFANRRAGMPRRKMTFSSRADAKAWLKSMHQCAIARMMIGPEFKDIADRLTGAANAMAHLSQDSGWYVAEWSKLNARAQLAVLFVKYQGRCVYCERKVVIGERVSHGATIDHVLPIIAGGNGAIENLVLACSRCNSKKKDRTSIFVPEFVPART